MEKTVNKTYNINRIVNNYAFKFFTHNMISTMIDDTITIEMLIKEIPLFNEIEKLNININPKIKKNPNSVHLILSNIGNLYEHDKGLLKELLKSIHELMVKKNIITNDNQNKSKSKKEEITIEDEIDDSLDDIDIEGDEKVTKITEYDEGMYHDDIFDYGNDFDDEADDKIFNIEDDLNAKKIYDDIFNNMNEETKKEVQKQNKPKSNTNNQNKIKSSIPTATIQKVVKKMMETKLKENNNIIIIRTMLLPALGLKPEDEKLISNQLNDVCKVLGYEYDKDGLIIANVN